MKLLRCKDVYDPEDDSYLMLSIPDVKGKILDMGSGTGIIGIHYMEKGNKVYFVDINENAVKCTKRNITANGMHGEVILSDLFSGIKGKFDFCLFNPPYLPSGDGNDVSWTGGKIGNEIINKFIEQGKNFCDVMYIIESSLAPVEWRKISDVTAEVRGKITYHLEEIRLVRVTKCRQ